MSDDPILISQRQIDDAHSTPFHDALARLDTHGEGFALEIDRSVAAVEVRKDLGKAWTVSGAASRAWSGRGMPWRS